MKRSDLAHILASSDLATFSLHAHTVPEKIYNVKLGNLHRAF